MTVHIRPGRIEDAAALPAIERAAGALFRSVPELAWIAEDDVLEWDDHHDAIMRAEGDHWVAEVDGVLAGFLVGQRIGADFHIWELAVDTAHQGRGVGRALVTTACNTARDAGCATATLTTFRAVPWNEPFYQRTGFVTLTDDALDDSLREVLDREAANGLPRERRCAMRLVL